MIGDQLTEVSVDVLSTPQIHRATKSETSLCCLEDLERNRPPLLYEPVLALGTASALWVALVEHVPTLKVEAIKNVLLDTGPLIVVQPVGESFGQLGGVELARLPGFVMSFLFLLAESLTFEVGCRVFQTVASLGVLATTVATHVWPTFRTTQHNGICFSP